MMYYSVGFEDGSYYSCNIISGNTAAEIEYAAQAHADRYGYSIAYLRECEDYEIDEAKRKGKPIWDASEYPMPNPDAISTEDAIRETDAQDKRNIMHEADVAAIEGGYAAAKKYEAAGNRLKEILSDPTQHRYLDRAQEQYTTATRRFDAWCDLQDALKEIDRHGYCYLLALLIVQYGKAEQIVRFIMRKAKSICEDEHITLYNNPRISPQTITMWAINQYGGLLTQADMDAAIAWRKQCLTIRTKK